MSLDRVIVDLSRSFEQSQIYVAREYCSVPEAVMGSKTNGA
jgi:hypothetical protein